MQKNLNGFASHTIGDREYSLTKLQMVDAARIASRIGKLLLPMLAEGQNLKQGDLKDVSKLGGILASCLDKVDSDALYDDSMHCLKKGCHVNGYNIAEHHYFEKHFSEYPQDLFPVLLWALKENIGGFFGIDALFQGKSGESDTPSSPQKVGM